MITRVTSTFRDGYQSSIDLTDERLLRLFRYVVGKRNGTRPLVIEVEGKDFTEKDWREIWGLQPMVHPSEGEVKVNGVLID